MVKRLIDMAPITVIVGHAGVGKTNVSLGLALAASAERCVTLADLDVVNPYFRSSDYDGALRAAGVRLIAPVLARTTLDTPSLTGELDAAIEQTLHDPEGCRLIIDVGGDDDGATALGRWSRPLAAAGDAVQVLYAVSAFRALTTSPEAAADLLPGIEAHAHLKATGILNTSNLGDETTADHVERGRRFAAEVARLTGLPLTATVAPAVSGYAAQGDSITAKSEPVMLMPRHVRLPWD